MVVCVWQTVALSAFAGSPQKFVPISWKTLRPGLELARVDFKVPHTGPIPDFGENLQQQPLSEQPYVMLLRINPTRYIFTLHMASEDNATSSMPELAKRHGLVAAINASMYLPDKKTSTGYLRSASHTNNPKIMEKFGAFLVANPKKGKLPPVRLLDRGEDDWQQALQEYSLAVQNYRLNNAQGKVLWAQDNPPHSVAALSQDNSGHIIFMLCPVPVPPASFATAMLQLPIKLRTLMYLEGGPQAAMLVHVDNTNTVWTGHRAGGLWTGNPDAALPNVLGVKPR